MGTSAGVGFDLLQLPSGAPRRVNVDAGALAGLAVVGSSPARVVVIAGTPGDSTARLLSYDITAGTWSTIATGGLQPVALSRSPDAIACSSCSASAAHSRGRWLVSLRRPATRTSPN